jgi:ABC-type polysaccharide/polyol phosphate export permease
VVVEGFRHAIIGRGTAPTPENILLALAFTGVTLIIGMLFFKRFEANIADVV